MLENDLASPLVQRTRSNFDKPSGTGSSSLGSNPQKLQWEFSLSASRLFILYFGLLFGVLSFQEASELGWCFNLIEKAVDSLLKVKH